ncbi:beta strand repeat-containing protein [Occallatibacter savannae]|uniref:beta strand repeat-containing protein n=1 Tax=Occallatibacter savannae TaxID=1002691 RepID=UPI000D68D9BA|nr:Ig-like domain-containing protein [Occallatibacter savannae]
MKRIGAIVCSILFVCLGFSGCGGGSSHKSTQSSGATRTLASITVYGANAARSLSAGTTLQLTAQGNYSDGTIADITSQVTWSSSDSTIAKLSTAGLLTSYKSGSVIATATQGTVSGTLAITVNGAALSSITVSGNGALAAGQSEQLAAQGTYTDSSTQVLTSQVSWSTSDATVATVSNTGMLKSLKAGTVTITATMNSVSGTAGVTVGSAVLSTINVGVTAASLASGNTEQLTATAVYSDNSTQTVTSQAVWQSSDATVASIAAGGLLTALKTGNVTVTATWNSISGNAGIAVTAPALSSITVSPVAFSIASGQNKQLSALGTYSDGTSQDVTSQATWSSSTSAAGVSASGLVTGSSAGTSTITATIGSKSGSAVATVSAAALQSISLNPLAASIATGQTQVFAANGMFSDGSQTDITSAVTWSSASTNFATIDQTGLATGVSAGVSAISAASGSVTSAVPAQLTVTPAVLTEIDIAPDAQYIPVGGQLQLSLTGTYSDGSTQDVTANATWSSSDPTLASVDPATGIVTGVANSNNNPVTITATYGSITNTTTVYVTDAVPASIQLTPATASIASGTTQQYAVNVVYTDGSLQPVTTGLSWLSSSASVAGVNSNGLATAIAPGKTTISVFYDGMSATASLTVTQAVLTNLVVTPITTVVGVNGNVQFTATGVFSDNSTQDLSSQAVWSSSNGAFATISASGLATGISAGSLTISATSGAISGSATLNVTTATLQSITISPANPIVPPHSRVQLTAIGHFSDGSTQVLSGVTWRSSKPQYAMVSSSGVLRTKNAKNKPVIVSATLNGIPGTTTVTVTAMTVQTVAIQPANPTMAAGTKLQLSLIGTFSDGVTQIDLTASARWQTSNYADAVVNRQGLVSGIAAGSVTVTGGINGVASASTTLTVTNATVQNITVTPANPTVALGSSQQFAASGSFSDGSTQDITNVVTWTSSTPTVAVVNQSGMAASASHGTTNITATLTGINGSTQLTVN